MPALCSTPVCIQLWSDMLVWLCGSMSGTKTSRMKPVQCPALCCVRPGTGGRTMGTAGNGVSGFLRRRALLTARKISSCLDPEVWFPTMDAGRIGAGRIVYAVVRACKEFRSLIANAESLDALLQSSAAFPRISCRKRTKTRNSGPSLGRACSGPSGERTLKMVAARSSSRHQRN